jgi:hypothetical protein
VPDRVAELAAVATLELLTRDPLLWVLRVEVKRVDLEFSAVPALEPRGPL